MATTCWSGVMEIPTAISRMDSRLAFGGANARITGASCFEPTQARATNQALRNNAGPTIREKCGSFRIRHRNARVGRNPKTGDKVRVPAKRIPYFKPGKELREMLNAD